MDKRSIVENVRRSGEIAAGVLVPRGTISGYVSPAGLGRDAAQARALLSEAGYPGGVGMPPIELLFNKDAGHDLIAQAIAKDWERELGVRIRLEQVEVKVFRERLKNADFMVSRAAWFGDYGDPTTFLNINRTGDGNNDRKYSSKEFDALLDRAEEAGSAGARMELLARAERLLVEEDLPLIPIFQYVQLYLFDATRLTGISGHARCEQQLFRVDMLGDGVGANQPLMMRKGDPNKGSFRLNAGGTEEVQ
jgi:oligopeptide transport system substrate-binding protein